MSPTDVADLCARAGGATWDVSPARFARVLEAALAKGFSDAVPSATAARRYLEGLRLGDLALACACIDGHERAWEHIVREYRPYLYRAADALDASGGARDLADALYGELFGLSERDGERQSLFRYYHGRSSLVTWMRAVLAQRHVDRLRGTRRLEPLSEQDSEALAVPQIDPSTAVQPGCAGAVQAALGVALQQLAPRDRLRLACYYAQNLTLAQIARMTREHEATVSRQLARARRTIRERVEAHLAAAGGMAPARIAECLAEVAADAGVMDLQMLFGDDTRKNTSADRSREGEQSAG